MAFTPEEEKELELATEVRHRAFVKNQTWLEKQAADKACKTGNHADLDSDRKCKNCGEKIAAPATEKKKSSSIFNR